MSISGHEFALEKGKLRATRPYIVLENIAASRHCQFPAVGTVRGDRFRQVSLHVVPYKALLDLQLGRRVPGTHLSTAAPIFRTLKVTCAGSSHHARILGLEDVIMGEMGLFLHDSSIPRPREGCRRELAEPEMETFLS